MCGHTWLKYILRWKVFGQTESYPRRGGEEGCPDGKDSPLRVAVPSSCLGLRDSLFFCCGSSFRGSGSMLSYRGEDCGGQGEEEGGMYNSTKEIRAPDESNLPPLSCQENEEK